MLTGSAAVLISLKSAIFLAESMSDARLILSSCSV